METPDHKLDRRALLTALVGAAALVAGGAATAGAARTRGEVTLYKNPQCGCCEGYADYLRDNGFAVTAIATNDLTAMGQKFRITDDLQPCHISLIGGYVVGGHIPIQVIERLLNGRPKLVGITLPGMPEGTPGMPGNKPGPIDIYEIGGNPPKVYATI